MFFIGIDSSTTNTAIVVLDEDKTLVDFVLLSPKHKDIHDRSVEIVNKLMDFVVKYSPSNCTVGIEAASFQSKGMRDKLSMLLGAIYYSLRRLDYSVKLLPPPTIKKQYTGNGRAKKDEMSGATPDDILTQFKIYATKLDDLVDAYAIATIL